MPRRSRVDPDMCHAVALFGVAAVADLAALGMPRSTIARRVRAQRYRQMLRGVVLLVGGTPTVDQRAAAALAYAGPGAVISGAEALRRHGLKNQPSDERILVLVPAESQRTSSAFVVVERSERLPDGVDRDGITVAPLERAVIDTVRRTDRRDEVRAVVAEAVQRRFTTVERLKRELAAGSQRGSALVREVLAEIDGGTRSVAESWAKETYARSGLPPIVWNPRLFAPTGEYIGSPDGYIEEVGLAWEIDSLEYHLSPEDWDRTLRHRARMTTYGLVVAHIRPGRLRTERAGVIEELLGAYRLAASRPCPPIVVRPAA